MAIEAPPPTRARVLARGILGMLTPALAIWGLHRLPWSVSPALAWGYLLVFLTHWLIYYPRVLCVHCAHYGRVCPSWGGKLAALLYDRAGEAANPAAFARHKRWGMLAGIGLRAAPLLLLAWALSGPARTDSPSWMAFAALALLAWAEGALYFGRLCRGCRMSIHCPARWGAAAPVLPPIPRG